MGGSQPASKPKKTSTMHLKPLASCATRRRQALPPSSLRPATLPKEDTHYIFRASDQLCYPGKTSTIFPEPACCAIRRRQALSLARRLAGCSIQAGGVGARLVSGRESPGLDGCPGIHQSISPVPPRTQPAALSAVAESRKQSLASWFAVRPTAQNR